MARERGSAILTGEEASSTLRKSLDQVAELVPYLRAQVGQVPCAAPGSGAWERAGDEGAWLSCRDLVDHPAALAQVVRTSGLLIGTEDPMVAASLFVQGYAYRVIALAVACMMTSGVVPDCTSVAMAVGLSRGRPSRVAYLAPGAFATSDHESPTDSRLASQHVVDDALGFLIERAIAGHLRPLIDGLRREIRVGERLLWGNVAASAATAFRTMEGSLGEWVTAVGTRFFELAPPEFDRQGSFLTIDRGEKHGWFWERTNCCLYDRLPGDIRCADCSRTPRRERRAAYEASLSADQQ
jgi:ferric iron reductase protein FhuF